MILKDFGRDRCVFEGFGRLSEDVVGRAKLTFRSLSFTFVRFRAVCFSRLGSLGASVFPQFSLCGAQFS